MVQNSLLLSRISKPLPCKWLGDALSPVHPCKRHWVCPSSYWNLLNLVLLHVNSHVKQLEPLPDGYDRVRRLHSQSSGDHWVPTKRHQTQLVCLSSTDATLRSWTCLTYFHLLTHYLTHAVPGLILTQNEWLTYLLIVPYDIITDVTMTHADSQLLITYVIMTHTD